MSVLRARSSSVLFRSLLQSRACVFGRAGAGPHGLPARHVAASAAALSGALPLPALGSLGLGAPFQVGMGARFLSSAQRQPQPKQDSSKADQGEYDSLELTQEKIHAITDKIPQRPVGVVEGTSYTLLILAAFAVLAFFVYNFLMYFVFEPVAMTCFNTTVEKLRMDPRITVRLGNDITAYGQESPSRVARQQIPHVIYKDNNGVEHVRFQFHMRGPSGAALVNGDMYKDENGKWQYTYLIADVVSESSPAQRLNIIAPK